MYNILNSLFAECLNLPKSPENVTVDTNSNKQRPNTVAGVTIQHETQNAAVGVQWNKVMSGKT